MKKILPFIVFFYSALFFAQTNNQSYEFEFYKNGYFKKTKNLKIQLAKNSDTISCEIANGKIMVPKNLDTYNVIVNFRKEKYVVPANKFGKIATLVFSIAIMAILFAPEVEELVYLVYVALILKIVAFSSYAIHHSKNIRNLK